MMNKKITKFAFFLVLQLNLTAAKATEGTFDGCNSVVAETNARLPLRLDPITTMVSNSCREINGRTRISYTVQIDTEEIGGIYIDQLFLIKKIKPTLVNNWCAPRTINRGLLGAMDVEYIYYSGNGPINYLNKIGKIEIDILNDCKLTKDEREILIDMRFKEVMRNIKKTN